LNINQETVAQATATVPGASATPTDDAGNAFGSRTFVVRFSPAARGDHAGHYLEVSGEKFNLSGRGAEPEIIVTDPGNNTLTYHATTYPQVTLPSSAFGSSTTPQTFTISNQGIDPLQIDSITVTGGQDSAFGMIESLATLTPTANTLNALAGETTFTVTFTPTRGGNHTTTLTINHRDLPKSPFKITLNAEGLAGEIAVKDPDDNPLTYSSTPAYPSYTFPESTVVGTKSQQQFTIENTGNNPLAITSINTDNPTDFTVKGIPTNVAAPVGGQNGSGPFSVTFNPSTRGMKTATLTITSSDPEESSFNITLNATAVAPDIIVTSPATAVPAGQTLAYVSTPTVTLPSSPVIPANPSVSTFTIENSSSTAALTISNIQSDNAEFVVSNVPGNVAANGSETFTVTFRPSGSGQRTATLSISSNDETKLVFNIALSASGLASDLLVKKGSTPLAHNSLTNLGTTPTVSDSSHDFTLENAGNLDLTINGITSSDPGVFTIVQPSPSSVPARTNATNGTQAFTVTFNPSGQIGPRGATVSIDHNDSNKPNPFLIQLTATGSAAQIKVKAALNPNQEMEYIPYRVPDGNGNPPLPVVTLASTSTGDPETSTFRVENSGNQLLTITSITSSNLAEFTVDSGSFGVTADTSADFVVTFNPQGSGTAESLLTIASNDPNRPSFQITLRGSSLAPRMGAVVDTVLGDGDIVNFSPQGTTVYVGSISKKTLTITNTGGSLLNLTFKGITGKGDFTIIPALNLDDLFELQPGTNRTFTLEYKPVSAEASSSSLSFLTNDPDITGYFDIRLEGTASSLPEGSDTFGYKVIPGNSGFTDIRSSGTRATGLDRDDVAEQISIGFDFQFYDRTYKSVFANSNGLLRFGGPSTSYRPHAIPDLGGQPKNIIAPFWTDLRADSGGQVYSRTVGIPPNQTFILQYHNMPLYQDRSKKYSFQIKLSQGTNSIEFVYQNVPHPGNVSSNLLIGIENYEGVGIQEIFGPLKDIYNQTRAIKFTRPALVDIRSTYEQPPVQIQSLQWAANTLTIETSRPNGVRPGDRVEISGRSDSYNGTFTIATRASRSTFTIQTPSRGTTSAAGGGTIHNREAKVGSSQLGFLPDPRVAVKDRTVDVGSTQDFEAPEYIYLNKDFSPLDSMGPSDLGYDQDGLAVYRLKNEGYAIDTVVTQGTSNFFQHTVNKDISVVWKWKLQFAAFIDATTSTGTSLNGGIGNPDPATGRIWVDANTGMSAAIDRVIGNDFLSSDTSGYRYATRSYQVAKAPASAAEIAGSNSTLLSTPNSSEAGNRLQTRQVTITDWTVIRWNMQLQVRYTFAAGVGIPEQQSNVLEQSFVHLLNGIDEPETLHWSRNYTANVTWIDAGRSIWVGSFYRTADRCLTLGDFNSPPSGDLQTIGRDISVFDDQMVDDNVRPNARNRVARVYQVKTVSQPTTINFAYVPTVFRAEIPLGQAFDAENPSSQLVPDLCENAILRMGSLGPGDTAANIRVGPEADGTANQTPLRWDQVGKRLFPVHPGSFQIDWPDQDGSGNSYKIEIVTGYPRDTVPLASEREEDIGDVLKQTQREINAGAYVRQTTLASVDDDFPGHSPTAGDDAHYRYLHDPAPSRQAPLKLDISSADQWNFEELTFIDRTTRANVSTTTTGVPFTARGEGRCVLLYSYRANPDEIATGDLTRENLAVRVVRSKKRPSLPVTDPALVLGERGLTLSDSKQIGIIQSAGSTPEDPGTGSFTVDFWQNASDLRPDDAEVDIFRTQDGALKVTLSNNLTEKTTVVSSSNQTITTPFSFTSSSDIRVTNMTTGATLVSGTDFTAIPGSPSGSVALIDATIDDTISVQLAEAPDPQPRITATYRGVTVSHDFTPIGSDWRHYVVHVFTKTLFGTSFTVVNFYADGIRAEKATRTSAVTGGAPFTVAASVAANSLRFGVGANSDSRLHLDNFRLFTSLTGVWLTSGEIRDLRSNSGAADQLRSTNPDFLFDFEGPDPFTNKVASSLEEIGDNNGPLASENFYNGSWARIGIQEVATRITSTLDDAGFDGNGYILNRISNYNANLYNREAEIGDWGPLYPVNHKSLYPPGNRLLEAAYYENPFRQSEILHPNVAWPYVSVKYEDVTFPANGPHKDKRIYIASRVGSEGVDLNGKLQQVYRLGDYANFSIYNQPARNQPGFNPNEEHAFAAGSNRAALRIKEAGEGIPNNPPLAAFALQKDINIDAIGSSYTSAPWVLVQVDNLTTGEPEMAAYEVESTRAGADDEAVPFPRPTDAQIASDPNLVYESAANPEDRFLTMDPDGTYNFKYEFSYPAAAGDLLIPPYPLNLVIGNAVMADSRGGNVKAGSPVTPQRTLWRDVNRNAWIVSGGGKFFYQYFYPFRPDFYLPGVAAGAPVAFLPSPIPPSPSQFRGDNRAATSDDAPSPVKITYETYWRSDYPKLKRGETLTYQGGEYFNETPGAQGLPALVAMAAAEVVYDSATPSMVLRKTGFSSPASYNVEDYSARIIRPLDRREKSFTVAQMDAAGFTPASPKILIIAERWYFKDLPGSLQKRFYFDSLAEKLVLRGYLNDKDSGNPDLTAGPDPLNILEPNVLTNDEYSKLLTLSNDSTWRTKAEAIFKSSRAPDPVRDANRATLATDGKYYAGVQEPPAVSKDDPSLSREEREKFERLYTIQQEIDTHWSGSAGSYTSPTDPPAGEFAHLNSFGVGAALVGGPGSLIASSTPTPTYITIAENNREELDGAPISLHIIELIPDRYRGALKVIEGADAFSEKITIQHNGEFGANTNDLYYEWWIRDAGPLDIVAGEIRADATLKESDPATGQSLWQQYLPKDRAELNGDQKHLGLHSIVFEGRPDITLADKMVLMRYRHKYESDWTLVPFEITNPAAEWNPGVSIAGNTITDQGPAPFQWAGAANSPQLQADGSKRYIPQLVMGWVKRVLDRINPYEARYTDFFSNETPATYSSQIQIAGAPFAGKVALNPDKNVIENTGLIELYETVLARAKELSIDNSSNPVSTDGINQALLLAATRLAVLYELLAREAYSDAQDSTITVSDDGGLTNVASYTHAFQNFEASLMHEELSLLRGTDFRKSYPVFNRMFWNFAKGLGEAAYTVNYNIYDENTDGFINEDDARALYPQGHGDSWGHFLSALGMHYELLQQPVFRWNSRPELYSLMENVLEVDYLDEKTFAKLAAGKARAGRDIVRGTYRLHYTQDPDGQWQGYRDGADPARSWGVSEWAHRSGQGAYFDWAVANALLPEDAANGTPVPNPEGLDRIQRSTATAEIGEVAGALLEIQAAMDEANNGVNPLGFDSNALSFAMNVELGLGLEASHFEQIYDRALVASNNALATLNFAAMGENKLRRIADDTESLIVEALSQDIDYRNQLIEIFGRPYDGTIGFGKVYPEGYLGPDTLLYAYLDKTEISQIVPQLRGPQDTRTANFNNIYAQDSLGIMDNPEVVRLYNTTGGLWRDLSTDGASNRTQRVEDFETLIGDNDYDLEAEVGDLSVPYDTASEYGFTAPSDWGKRTSHGQIQTILEEWLLAEITLDDAIINYIGFLQDWEAKTARTIRELEIFSDIEEIRDDIDTIRRAVNGTFLAIDTIIGLFDLFEYGTRKLSDILKEGAPSSVGFSNDIGAIARGIGAAAEAATSVPVETAKKVTEIARRIAEMIRDETIVNNERNIARLEQLSAFQGMVEELVNLSGSDQPMRDTIGTAIHEMELKKQAYTTTLAQGFRLMREREAFNKVLAASVQKNRYQDMLFRLSRNEAMAKYQTAFNHAARYTWMATRAYDFETSFDPGHPAAPGTLMDQVVKERNLGLWVDGQPAIGQGGLAEILAQLKGNFEVLKGQIGIMTPQIENGEMSLRRELFRIQASADGTAASDDRWKNALRARIVPDVTVMPEFIRNCRPFSNSLDGAQPALVIPFSSHIQNGRNFFGRPLAAGDHSYSTANFATKIHSLGIWLVDYTDANLAAAPRCYLVPVGNDYLRTSSAPEPTTRVWSLHEQRVPTPFIINQGNLRNPGFIPGLDGVDGEFGSLRRHGDFRMYGYDSDTDGFLGQFDAGMDAISFDTRLMGRSVWNSQWIFIIPGTNLHPDPQTGLTRFIENVSDIRLHFVTYSHQGQ